MGINTFKRILTTCININKQDKYGRTPLHIYKFSEINYERATALIEMNADIYDTSIYSTLFNHCEMHYISNDVAELNCQIINS